MHTERCFNGLGAILPLPSGEDAAQKAHSRQTDPDRTCGWLLKKKSSAAGSRKLWSTTNRRFFTLDTCRRLFYYAHSESAKKISRPILVKDISEVKPLAFDGHSDSVESDFEDTCNTAASCSTERSEDSQQSDASDDNCSVDSAEVRLAARKARFAEDTQSVDSMTTKIGKVTSTKARIGRIPSFRMLSLSGRSRGSDHHGFILHIGRPVERKMELLCSCKAEAQQWIAALDFAIRLAQAAQPQFMPPTATALLAFGSHSATVADPASEASSEIADWQSDISCR